MIVASHETIIARNVFVEKSSGRVFQQVPSARVALALRNKGVKHVRPLAGGLQAWRDRGFSVTAEVRVPVSAVARG